MSLLNRFKKNLSQKGQRLFGVFGRLFGAKHLDPKAIETIEEALYSTDFGHETTTEIIDVISEAYKRDKSLRGQEAAQLAKNVLRRILENAEGRLNASCTAKPQVICVLGVNGVGKTTTIAKLGYRFQKEGKKVMLGACDTFRAAANEQINVWAERLALDIISSHHGADAASVAYDAYSAARSQGHDILLLDTAGRLHTKNHLMRELAKLKRVLSKQADDLPHHSWLVVDGNLGSNSIEQARVFHKEFGLTGLIITKLDGTARGGGLVGIYRQLNVPLYFVGLGERPEDLQPFSIERYLDALFKQP